MDGELDVNKVAAEFLSTKIDGAFDLLRSQAKGARNIIRSKFERTYRAYLERVLGRYSRGKSFFIRSEPTPLYSFFVPLDLKTQRKVLPKASLSDLAELFPLSIITGSGGSGKTMIMRHLLVGAIQQHLKTPIFLELRQLNSAGVGVREALLGVLKQNGLDVSAEYFDLALQDGHFALLLDGFDELQFDRRENVSIEVQRLSERFPRNLFILSSRPDEKLEGWGDFAKLQVCPLDLERAAELISKVPFEDAIKERFISDLKSDLFSRHESFLSNPLLLSIMLLTYHDAAHIPNKLSVFYGQAYESLFQKHDALKAGFRRQRRTNLDIQDFERVFSAFSVQSFDRREFSFTRVRAAEVLESTKKLVHVSYDARAFLDDCVQATCLLIEEGLEITFAHRSFQEYFAARFIAAAPEGLKSKLITHLGASHGSDLVILLLHEMDPYSVERYYILPAIQELRQVIGCDAGASDEEQRLAYLKNYWNSISVTPEGQLAFSLGLRDAGPLIFAARRFGWPSGGKSPNISAVVDAVKEGADKRGPGPWSMSTSSLTLNHTFFTLTRDRDGIVGAPFIKRLAQIAAEIEANHKDMCASIEQIIDREAGHRIPRRRDSEKKRTKRAR